MRILVLSNTPWSNDNSFGNSFSNIFEGISELEFANIYCRYGRPSNNIVKKYYQITEKSLLRNLFNKNYPSGKEITDNEYVSLSKSESNILNHARKNRLQIYFIIREIIWKIGRWKSKEFERFIIDFKPDLLFQPVYYSGYLNDIALYIKRLTNVPMICYVSDDVYTLRQFSLSPLFWLRRLLIRPKIKKIINKCSLLYVISDMQKKEYEKCFGVRCKILTKGADFSGEPSLKESCDGPITLVYTGNIGSGRWKMLALLAKAIKEANKEQVRAKLHIYTMTPVSKRIKDMLNIENSSYLMGGVPFSEVKQIQQDADVLVHVESFSLKERLKARQSFSTKLVDYFHACRCIFAIGSMDLASIYHLHKNDAAVIATSKDEIKKRLNDIINDPGLLRKYAINAWKCGRFNHQITDIRSNLMKDIKEALGWDDENSNS